MSEVLIKYTEYNGWENETWWTIYICNESLIQQAQFMQTFCIQFNLCLHEKDEELDMRRTWRPEISAYRSHYSVSIHSMSDLSNFKKRVHYDGYKRNKIVQWNKQNLPFYEQVQVMDTDGIKLSDEVKFDKVFSLFYKKFTD